MENIAFLESVQKLVTFINEKENTLKKKCSCYLMAN